MKNRLEFYIKNNLVGILEKTGMACLFRTILAMPGFRYLRTSRKGERPAIKTLKSTTPA